MSLETLILPVLYVAVGYLLRHLGLFQKSTPKTPAGPLSMKDEVKQELVTLEQEALVALQKQLTGVARDALQKALSGLQVPAGK